MSLLGCSEEFIRSQKAVLDLNKQEEPETIEIEYEVILRPKFKEGSNVQVNLVKADNQGSFLSFPVMTEAQTRSLLEQQNQKLLEQFKEELRCIHESLSSARNSSGGLDYQTGYRVLLSGIKAVQKGIAIKANIKEV